jgi:hypothetical protein
MGGESTEGKKEERCSEGIKIKTMCKRERQEKV